MILLIIIKLFSRIIIFCTKTICLSSIVFRFKHNLVKIFIVLSFIYTYSVIPSTNSLAQIKQIYLVSPRIIKPIRLINFLHLNKIKPEDKLPQQVCKCCITSLLSIYKTIENYRTNDLKLRKQLESTMLIDIKQEEEEVDMEVLEKTLTLKIEEINVVKHEDCSDDELNSVVTNRENFANEIYEETIDKEHEDERMPRETNNGDNDTDYLKENRRKATINRRKTKKCKQNDLNRPRLHDHKCYICKSESHGSAEALITHLNAIHLDKLPFTCTVCVMETVVINSVQKLNAHMRQHLNPEKCPYCDRRYTNKNNVATHVQLQHQNYCPSKCEKCGKEYPTKVALLYHMKQHSNAASCEICGKIFMERQKLRLHIQRSHEKIKNHECNICKKKLGWLESLKTHIKTYHMNQEFKCSYCPKTFAAEQTHRSHEQKHIANPDYVASRNWSEYYTIVEGEENKQGVKLKKCNLCEMVCKSMALHLSTVHFPTEYRCKICDATFKHKQKMEQHVSKHEGGKPYECPICKRRFSDRQNLIAHLRTKQHRDHPMAQSLDWLKIDLTKAKPRKSKEEFVDLQIKTVVKVANAMDNSF